MFANNQGIYLNKSETDVEFEILFIASPIRPEIGKTSIFLTFLVFATLSIVSVITKFFITEFFILFTATPIIFWLSKSPDRYLTNQSNLTTPRPKTTP